MDGHSSGKCFNVFEYLFKRKKAKDNVSKEDIIDLISKGNEEGVINQTAKEMLYGVFEFNDKVASEIMTSRVEVLAIDILQPIEEIMQVALNHNFSRIPVYEEDQHHIIGVLHVKDFLSEVFKVGLEHVNVRELILKPYFVPETKTVQRLFKELQHTKNHMAILVDEYGDFAGIVTVEDIVEEIVGDILDENEQNNDIAKMEDGSYLVDGLTHIDDINKQLNLGIECENFDTIGGFVVNLLGNIPQSTQEVSVTYNNIVFEVEKVKSNRVERLRIYRCADMAV